VLWVVFIATGVVLADQLTKWLVLRHISEVRPVSVIAGFFQLVNWRNTGAAWGLLGGHNAWLAVLSVVVLALMVVYRRAFLSPRWEHRLALGLLGGGIIGNILDRLRLGWVTDFLDFHWQNHHWPCFNIADAAICTGVALYILSSFWLAGHPLRENNGRPPAEPA